MNYTYRGYYIQYNHYVPNGKFFFYKEFIICAYDIDGETIKLYIDELLYKEDFNNKLHSILEI